LDKTPPLVLASLSERSSGHISPTDYDQAQLDLDKAAAAVALSGGSDVETDPPGSPPRRLRRLRHLKFDEHSANVQEISSSSSESEEESSESDESPPHSPVRRPKQRRMATRQTGEKPVLAYERHLARTSSFNLHTHT